MSTHVTVNCHTCGETLNHGRDHLPSGLGPLFDELGAPVREWHGKTGVDVLPKLASAIRELEQDIGLDDYRRRHDGGGTEWSRIDFALPFLRAMRDAICRDPWAVIHA